MKKINPLPESQNEFWENAEKYISQKVAIPICESHKKDWQNHKGYIDNHDGTISCKYCPWGCYLPGYMKVANGEVYDLRSL